MTPERDMDLDLETNIASATEFTGMLPAITSHNDPEALAAAMDMPAPVIAAREARVHPPQPDADARPSGAHSLPKTKRVVHPAKAPGPYHRDSARNP